MVEQPDAVQGGERNGLEAVPWSAPMDHRGLLGSDDGLGERVVVARADAADGRRDARLGQHPVERLLTCCEPRPEWWTTPVLWAGRPAWSAASAASGARVTSASLNSLHRPCAQHAASVIVSLTRKVVPSGRTISMRPSGSDGSKAGPAFERVLIFKIRRQQTMHGLRGERCGDLIKDRLSFMRCPGVAGGLQFLPALASDDHPD